MNEYVRVIIAQQNDAAIAARIVRNIGDIERDYIIGGWALSERVMREATQEMVKAAPEPWQVVETEWTGLLLSPDWKLTKGLGNGDAWFDFGELSTDDEYEHSWLNAAVRAGPTQLCLELNFRKGLQDAAKATIKNATSVAKLIELGFVRDETETRLFIPIHIQVEALAMGFEENDLEQALTPVRQATELAVSAKAELDALIELVRAASKRK